VVGVALSPRHQQDAFADDEDNFVEIVGSPVPEQESPPLDPHQRTALEALVDSDE
jgi:hypothetical protein